jgi:hypothetical protein
MKSAPTPLTLVTGNGPLLASAATSWVPGMSGIANAW